jgi:DNA-binding transcriptional regulator LsrR (DeoR family)
MRGGASGGGCHARSPPLDRMSEPKARRGRPRLAAGAADAALTVQEELSLAARIARMYYLDDESKVGIAETLGLSRFQVARLLALARREGIVRIEVGDPGGVDRELSATLQERLGLRRVVVVSSSTETVLGDIGRTLTGLLAETVTAGAVVGLSWSRALRSMVEQLHDVPPCSFVQLAGQMSPEDESMGSVEMVRRAAEKTRGEAHLIYAPFLMPSSEIVDALAAQGDIARVVALFDVLDVAMISIGAWVPSSSVIYDALSESERREAASRGVIGDINGRMFGVDGKSVDPAVDGRQIGISIEQLRRVPEVICSSHGAYRADATLAAMRARFATTWVLDQALAHAILDRI